ncbi:hypothetical protein D3C71_1626200 [compost metagenome]
MYQAASVIRQFPVQKVVHMRSVESPYMWAERRARTNLMGYGSKVTRSNELDGQELWYGISVSTEPTMLRSMLRSAEIMSNKQTATASSPSVRTER